MFNETMFILRKEYKVIINYVKNNQKKSHSLSRTQLINGSDRYKINFIIKSENIRNNSIYLNLLFYISIITLLLFSNICTSKQNRLIFLNNNYIT